MEGPTQCVPQPADVATSFPNSRGSLLAGGNPEAQAAPQTTQAGDLSRNSRSKVQKPKRPRTPAQQAASMAALDKACAALQAQGYTRTPKRDPSNLRNLAKAREALREQRQQEKEHLTGTLEQVLGSRLEVLTSKTGMSFVFMRIVLARARSIKDSRLWTCVGGWTSWRRPCGSACTCSTRCWQGRRGSWRKRWRRWARRGGVRG